MAINEPVISWYGYVNESDPSKGIAPLNSWSAGTIQADSPTPPRKKFIIWNNKGGSVGVKTVEQPKIGTRDSQGGFNLPMVKERWVKGKFPVKNAWNDIDDIGGVPSTPIGAVEVGGVWTDEGYKMPIQAIGNVATNTIEGGDNDGTMEGVGNDKNYSIFELMIQVPYTASAGAVQARLRLDYVIS